MILQVPAEFVVQQNTNANPPTFFLALKSIISDMKQSPKGMSANERELVAKMYPKLQVSKQGSHYQNMVSILEILAT